MTDHDHDDDDGVSPATLHAGRPLSDRVQDWENAARQMGPDQLGRVVDRMFDRARKNGSWDVDRNEVRLHRSDLIALLERAEWPQDRKWCMFVPDHHQLTTTSTAEGDPEAALLGHVALALEGLGQGVSPQGRARVLRYLLDRETDNMRNNEEQ